MPCKYKYLFTGRRLPVHQEEMEQDGHGTKNSNINIYIFHKLLNVNSFLATRNMPFLNTSPHTVPVDKHFEETTCFYTPITQPANRS